MEGGIWCRRLVTSVVSINSVTHWWGMLVDDAHTCVSLLAGRSSPKLFINEMC